MTRFRSTPTQRKRRGEGKWEYERGRGRDCEKKAIGKQQLKRKLSVGALLRAQRSRAANYDSSGMSPELSAKRGIKNRAVSGPTASQSDSHVNNIDGICCNLGITLPTPQPEKGNLKICPFEG